MQSQVKPIMRKLVCKNIVVRIFNLNEYLFTKLKLESACSRPVVLPFGPVPRRQGNADQINFDLLDDVARIFLFALRRISRSLSQSRPILQLLRLFRSIVWRLSRRFAHYGRSSPLTMYKLLKANSTLSWASFLARPL